MVTQGGLNVLVFSVIVQVIVESRVVDCIYVYVFMGAGKGSLEEGVMVLSVGSMGGVEIL